LTDILVKTIADIKPLDKPSMVKAKIERQDSLTKRQAVWADGSFIRPDSRGYRGKPSRRFKQKAVIVMAADHGVAARGTSVLSAGSDRGKWCLNFLRGGAAINVISRQVAPGSDRG